jgi:DAK2 domain fusion protein YloV
MTNETQSASTGETQITQEITSINGQGLKALVEAALTWLKTNQQIVNSLNVFPVPDGDTGTNMLLTMQAAYNEIASSGENSVGKMAHSIAQGALMGARGNSGVILSQLWRGFARALDNLETMDADLLSRALTEAKNTAYKGVVRPVEGTILTVAKDVSIAAEKNIQETKDLGKILEAIVQAADVSVQHTPEQLPILKQAGVVDSGGKGLYFILDGMLRHSKHLPLDSTTQSVQPISMMSLENTLETIEPGQDYEVVIDFKPFQELDLETFYGGLSEIGTSIQLGEGDGMYRMHIHVPEENRNLPDEYIRKVGMVVKEARENLRAQMETIEQEQSSRSAAPHIEPGQIAVVAVSPGPGISRIFQSLGVTSIVSGGQTMNPSTEEIIHSFENLPTDKIVILPNNKNIVLAAQTAAAMTVKKVTVIPSTSVPQGLSAMLRFDPDGDFTEIGEEMVVALKEVETGEITVATRSIEINGVDVEQGQVIALHNGKLVYSAATIEDACIGLLEKAHADDKERITLFYGNNISKTDVNKIVDKIRAVYPSHEIEVHDGGQPHYQFILSIE